MIWFTALFPYVVMFTLLVKALTLPGAVEGLKSYVHVSLNVYSAGQRESSTNGLPASKPSFPVGEFSNALVDPVTPHPYTHNGEFCLQLE